MGKQGLRGPVVQVDSRGEVELALVLLPVDEVLDEGKAECV
jgi:hypothetical protein